METAKHVEIRALLYRGELEEAKSMVDAELARHESTHDTSEIWKFRFVRAEILTIRGRLEEALEYLDSFVPPRVSDVESVASVKMYRGYCSGILGRNKASHCLLIEAEHLAREAGHLKLLGEVLLCRAFILFREKNYGPSSGLYRSVLDLSGDIDDWHLRGHGLWGIGKNLMIQCQYRDALVWLEEALQVFETQSARLSVSTVWSELGVCYLGLGDDRQAMGFLQRSACVDYEAGLMHSYQIDLANIGNIHLHRSDYFTALSYYQRAVSLARQIKDPVSVKKWTYNINLTYARIKAAVDEVSPVVAPEKML